MRSTCRRSDLALVDFERVIEKAPQWADPYLERASLHTSEKRYEEAIADIERAIDRAPNWTEPYTRRAWAYKSLERFDEALVDVEKALDLGGDESNLRMQRAFMLVEHRPEEALEDFARVIELDPRSWNYRTRGTVLFGLGRIDDAIADADKAIELEPTNANFHLSRANWSVHLQDGCEQAIADANKALKIVGPGFLALTQSLVSAFHSTSLFLRCPDLHDPEAALELAQQAMASDTASSARQRILGLALYRVGRYAESRQVLEEALERMTSSPPPTTLFFLAMAHWKLNQHDEARSYYDRGVARMETYLPGGPLKALQQEEAERVLGLQR